MLLYKQTKIWKIKVQHKKVQKYCTKIFSPTPDANVEQLSENQHALKSWMKQTSIRIPLKRFSQIQVFNCSFFLPSQRLGNCFIKVWEVALVSATKSHCQCEETLGPSIKKGEKRHWRDTDQSKKKQHNCDLQHVTLSHIEKTELKHLVSAK